MTDERPGWEIEGEFYPHVGADGLLHGDYALIPEVTGLALDDFLEGEDLLRVETGWMAVALWHGNPELRRSQVVRLIERLPGDGAKRVGWPAVKAADGGPPAEKGEATSISSKSTTSDEPPEADPSKTGSGLSDTGSKEDATPEQSTRNGSGGQGSATGATSDPETSAPLKSAAA